MSQPSGLYEHIYGVPHLDDGLRYWRQLGFVEISGGALSARRSRELYGVESAVASVRLEHRAWSHHGLIRLMCWERPQSEGLQFAPPLAVGSRWSAMGTADILQIRDAYQDEAARTGERWDCSPIARLPIGEEPLGFYVPFRGSRELFVTGRYHRHAFLMPAGFAIPGYAHFSDESPLSCSAPVHGDIVVNDLGTTDFYISALGLEAIGTPRRSDGRNSALRSVLGIGEREAFWTRSFASPGQISGRLRIYAPEFAAGDLRDRARPGALGLCGFSYQYAAGTLGDRRERIREAGAPHVTDVLLDEFGEPAVAFTAPDGTAWVVVEAE